MPLDAVRRAAERLESSPLYGIVSRHLVELTRDSERLSATPMAADVGASSVHLIRALLCPAMATASGDAPRAASLSRTIETPLLVP